MKKTILLIILAIFPVFTFAGNKTKENEIQLKALYAKLSELNDSVNIYMKISYAYSDSLKNEREKIRAAKNLPEEKIKHKEIYDYYNDKYKENIKLKDYYYDRRKEIYKQIEAIVKPVKPKQKWVVNTSEMWKGYAAMKGIYWIW